MTKNETPKKRNSSEEQPKIEGTPLPAELPEVTTTALEIEELQKQLDQYKELLLRKAAEFENYKRRSENETGLIVKYATQSLLEDVLPVVDDFERSLKHSRESKDYEALIKGIELIYQKLLKVLEGRGVKTFATEGREFNVDFHDALMQVPNKDLPPHTVIQEVEKGYMLHDKILRHAKVIVSMAVEESTPEDKKGTSDKE